jgi:hypothetical protein
MPPKRWSYLEGAIYGFILGLVLYAATGLTSGASAPTSHLKALALFCLCGALAGIVVAFIRNRVVWRGFLNQEQRRGLSVHKRASRDS